MLPISLQRVRKLRNINLGRRGNTCYTVALTKNLSFAKSQIFARLIRHHQTPIHMNATTSSVADENSAPPTTRATALPMIMRSPIGASIGEEGVRVSNYAAVDFMRVCMGIALGQRQDPS